MWLFLPNKKSGNILATIFLQAEKLTKSFGDLNIFSDISLSLFQNQRTAIVAKNGTGKSTLLEILAGKEQPDSGKVVIRNGIRIGYLPQNPSLNESATILENVFKANNEVAEALLRYEEVLASGNEELMQEAIDTMDRLSLWDREMQAKQILSILRINELNQTVSTLSGGQRKRVALAATLIDEPDLLILDEPTNHLDLDMVEWLERYLTSIKTTLLMVTHDRYFLDRVCTDILEMDGQKLYAYRGNYPYFLKKRQERIDAKASEIEKATNLLRRETEWMNRMPQARGTKAKYRIDAFYKLRETALQQIDSAELSIKVRASRLGKKIMEIRNLSKQFDSKTILNNFSYTFNRFERLGIIGKNGTGKTTFLNLISGLIKADSGTIDPGSTLKIGYYRQDGMKFENNARVIDVVREIAEVVTLSDGNTLSVSQFLSLFLFPPEKQHVQVTKLSGGEKRRLYLLTILMTNPNFLILDEPTNDLDIFILNVLEGYLAKFPGVVIVVSHDRYFMDKVVDGLLIFEGDGIISGFPGNYSEYRQWSVEQEKEKQHRKKPAKPHEKRVKSQRKPKLTYAQKKELEQLSVEIEKLEQQKKALEEQLNSGTLTAGQLQEKSVQYRNVLNSLDTKELRWLELSELDQ